MPGAGTYYALDDGNVIVTRANAGFLFRLNAGGDVILIPHKDLVWLVKQIEADNGSSN